MSHSDDQVEPKLWLEHFQALNKTKDKFLERVKTIQAQLSDLESNTAIHFRVN